MEHLEEMDPGADSMPLGPHPLAFVAVLIGVLILAYASTNLFFQRVGATSLEAGPKLEDVPDVIGLTRADAVAALERVGFAVIEQSVPNASIPVDQVTEQQPTAGNRAEAGSEVTVVVSAGDGFVRVPDVRGSPLDELQLLFFTHGLGVGEVAEDESDAAAGEVISQDPQPGETVAAGTEVKVVVSSGPPIIEIPDVVDMEALDAARVLRAAGFDVVYRDRYSWRVDRGHAIGTDPEDEAPRGSLLTLDISRGRAPTTTTAPEAPEPSSTTTTTRPDSRETFAPVNPAAP